MMISMMRGLHPLGLAAEPVHFAGQGLAAAFLDGAAERIFLQKGIAPDLGQFRLPERDDALVHAGAGDLVDAHQHGFAALPARGAMLDEVRGQLVQAVVGGNDFVVLAEQLLQQGCLVRVELSLLNASAMRSLRSSRAMPSFSPRFSYTSLTVDWSSSDRLKS